jgi:6-phosphogluconolactonase
MSQPIVHVFDDEEQLAHSAADAIVFAALQAIAQRGRFHWAVAGGRTPQRTYGVLAAPPHREKFPWDRFDAWLGDERAVPSVDPASNHRMVLEHLFRPAGADPAGLHTFDTEHADPRHAARKYAEQLEAALPADPHGVPVLDLVLLGLGADAHTASWFPGSSFPDDLWVAAVDEEHAGYRRLTLTPTIVNSAQRVLFLVSGAAKKRALRRVFEGPRDPRSVPAQRVAPNGPLMWMIDRDAAGQFFVD